MSTSNSEVNNGGANKPSPSKRRGDKLGDSEMLSRKGSGERSVNKDQLRASGNS